MKRVNKQKNTKCDLKKVRKSVYRRKYVCMYVCRKHACIYVCMYQTGRTARAGLTPRLRTFEETFGQHSAHTVTLETLGSITV